ncbi:hypothetical protein D9Q98_001026 [Chlorella vulgaris]|uniref:Isochorismatase-like domain-containing protein n=1 Tax=Chlorella vulgaris TaxID=3077 RepID=A0A9D4TZI1_CHLVU|nr:hypothetical protein D9Q98_001026 [Chlorella vulgaris]
MTELPAIGAARQAKGGRSALLIIDMQNDFCLPNAPLCVRGAAAVLGNVIEAVETARAANVHVVWIIREHEQSGVDVELFREQMFRQGKSSTVRGTHGAELVEGLAVQPGELVVSKKRFSAFFNTNLDALLRRLGVLRVVLCGVQTPNCIRGTVWDAIALDYPQVTVLSDATASATHGVQLANLHDMRQCGVDTPTVAEWAAQYDPE